MANELTVVGAGYVGGHLLERVLDRGWEATGTGVSTETVEKLRETDVEAMRWDAREDGAAPLENLIAEGGAVLYSVPSLFREYEPGEGAEARHVAPAARALDAAERAGAERFVYLSSTSVYGDHDGAWVDETTPTDPQSPNGLMRRDIEAYLAEAETDLATQVVRLVGIYGPGRTMVDYVRSGRYKLVDGGTKPTNRIHVEDIVRGLVALLEGDVAEQSELYNFSDGNPERVVDVVDWLVERLDLERPPEISLEAYAEERGENAAARWSNTYRVGNDRMIEELDVELAYPDVFAGYADVLDI